MSCKNQIEMEMVLGAWDQATRLMGGSFISPRPMGPEMVVTPLSDHPTPSRELTCILHSRCECAVKIKQFIKSYFYCIEKSI